MPATDEERLLISLEASLAKFEREMNRATQVSTRSVRKIEADMARLDRSMSRVGAGLVRSLAGPAAALFTVQGITETVDAYIGMTNALKAAGLEGAALVSVQKELFAIAERQLAPVDDLTKLYGRLALSSDALGATQDDLLQLTEGVAAALKVSGTTAQSASGALTQFSQAMGGAVVRAEEFNSIVEGAPEIARAMARGLDEAGGSVAKLRQIVIAGQLSSEEAFRAFLKGSDETLATAEKMAPTLGQVWTSFRNELIAAVGQIDGWDEAMGYVSNEVKIAARDIAKAIEDIIRISRRLNDLWLSMQPPKTPEQKAAFQGRHEADIIVSDLEKQKYLDWFKRLIAGGNEVDQFIEKFKTLSIEIGKARAALEKAEPGEEFARAQAKLDTLVAEVGGYKQAAIGMFIDLRAQIAAATEEMRLLVAEDATAMNIELQRQKIAELNAQLDRMLALYPVLNAQSLLVGKAFEGWEKSLGNVTGRLADIAGLLGGFLVHDTIEQQAVAIDAADAATKRWLDTTADYLKLREGFIDTAAWDKDAYRIGFGSDTITDALGRVSAVTKDTRTTMNDALRDLERRITNDFAPAVIRGIGPQVWEGLTADAKAALVSLTYNYGTAADEVQAVFKQVAAGNMAAAADMIESYRTHNNSINAGRREQEAALLRGTATVAELASTSKKAADDQADADKRAADARRDLTASIEESSLAAERQAEIRKKVADIEAQGTEFARNAAYVTEYEITLAERLAEAKRDNIDLSAEQLAAIYAEADAKGKLAEQDVALADAQDEREAAEQRIVDQQEKNAEAMRNVGGAFEDAFVDAIVNAEDLDDVLKNLGKTLAEMAARAAFQNLFGGLFGGNSPIGFLGALFGGGRQHGGDVEAGKAYVVGEKRPELFVPKVPGRIIPQVPKGVSAGGSATVVSGELRGALDIAPSELFAVSVRDIAGVMITENNRTLPGYLSDRRRRGI